MGQERDVEGRFKWHRVSYAEISFSATWIPGQTGVIKRRLTAWCRKQNHGAAIGKAGRTWWYCVDQGEDLGFTLSAVVWPGETKQEGGRIEYSFKIAFAFSVENEWWGGQEWSRGLGWKALQKLRRCQMLDSLCVQAEVIGLSGKGDDLCKRIRGISGDSKVLLWASGQM